MKITKYEIGYAIGMVVGLFFVVMALMLVMFSHGYDVLKSQEIYVLGAALVLYGIFHAIGSAMTPTKAKKNKESTWGESAMQIGIGFVAAIGASAFLVAGIFMKNRPF